MGTATPAIETFAKALDGKFGLVELDQRFDDIALPRLQLIDLKQSRKRREIRAGIFSTTLLEAMGQTLAAGKQIILFQNRRGYAPHLVCEDCGHVTQCVHCDVSLTYHQLQNLLICHYCGYRTHPQPECAECGSKKIKHSGYGTEQLEDALQPFFPETRIQRMDLDTTRSKNSYDRILTSFEKGHIDILVGTQMVSKGLDFDGVDLVGIFDVDRIIHFPDFRSHERAYQLITQVSGRAGRKSGKGLVMIQTYDPEHVVFQHVLQDDYRRFYRKEILEREEYRYPPFVRLVKIHLRHAEARVVADAAQYMGHYLRQLLGAQPVVGPTEPAINRLRNKYLQDIHVKLELSALAEMKAKIAAARDDLATQKLYRNVQVVIDVDPL
jgi:primosomal protein N' (replication factor Y)